MLKIVGDKNMKIKCSFSSELTTRYKLMQKIFKFVWFKKLSVEMLLKI